MMHIEKAICDFHGAAGSIGARRIFSRGGQIRGLWGRKSPSGWVQGEPWLGLSWVEQCLTSHQTHYRSYRGRVFTGQMTQPTVWKHWRKTRD